MIAFGTFKLVGYFSRDLYRLAFRYDLEFGILLIVLGIIVLPRCSDVIGVLAAALGIAILADGLFKVRIAMDSRAFGIRDWWMILVLAVITCGAGGLLVLRPWQRAAAGTAVGRFPAVRRRAEPLRGSQHSEDY